MAKIKSIIKSIKNKILPKKIKKDYLNKGERYDPNIAYHFDQCHVSRYEFALKYLNQNDKVIDIACGTGWGSKILSEKCHSIIGVDISNDAIKFAKQNYLTNNSKFILSDFFKFSVKGDVVVSFETLEHIKAVSFEVILHKILSLTNHRIIGSVPYEESPGNNPHHLSFFLTETNFSILNEFGNCKFFYQDASGTIHDTSSKLKPQNLIFVFSKKVAK